MKEVKTGLVLEGGAMRGMYTAGILDVLMEEKIQVDGVIGVSAGAVFGCNYKSGQIGRTLRYNMKFCGDKRYGTLHSLLKTGDIYDVDLCYHQIPEILDPFDNEAFAKNPAEFFVVCTDVETGKDVYHKCTDCGRDDLKWMQASASMPLVSKVVEIDGYKLLDGGVADSIPIMWFRRQGYKKDLVILTRPEGYQKKKMKFQGAINKILHRYPNLAKAMAHRYVIYNKTLKKIDELKEKGEVMVLRPSRLIEVSRLEKDPEKLKALYQLGREDAMKNLDQIHAFLSK